MSLVTLEQAKSHLRITASTEDAEIFAKADEASAIILDYLKGRTHETVGVTAAITSSSVASPTVITTASPHPFVNTNTVVITGHLSSVPSLNGSHVVSNATADTFTIPVAVTTAGTGGTVSIPWTDDTVPRHVQAAVKLMLAHLWEHRGDDHRLDADVWLGIERLLMRSRDPALA
jgi:hypothetical protein